MSREKRTARKPRRLTAELNVELLHDVPFRLREP